MSTLTPTDDAPSMNGVMVEMETYECRACHVPQSLLQYTKNKQGHNGHERHCKDCMSKARKGVARPGRQKVLALPRRSDAKDPAPAYDRLFQAQRGRCGSCDEAETAREPSGAVRRLTFYVFANTTIRSLLCLTCLTVIHQTGASVRRCARVTAFLASGLTAERGALDTLNLEGKI